MSTQAIADLIASFQPSESDLASFRALLERLGNPHHHLPPTIHVAGTNGKGSTLAYLDSIMRLAGHRVHRYTSPHFVSVCERIQTANQLISEERLLGHIQTIKDNAQALTFFHILTAAAFLEYAATPADYLLLETGLGGRLDPTNVVEHPIMTIITQVGMDHTNVLGDNIEDIALAKAGIIKSNSPVITYAQDPVIMKILQNESSTPIEIAKIDSSLRPSLPGAHQLINASLAGHAARLLGVSEEIIHKGIAHTSWPGRMQKVIYQGREVWLDMAHNASSAQAACQAMQKPFHLIFSLRDSKDLGEFLKAFKNSITSACYVPIASTFACGHPIEYVLHTASRLGIPMNQAPLDAAITSAPDMPVLITGSALLLSDIMKKSTFY